MGRCLREGCVRESEQSIDSEKRLLLVEMTNVHSCVVSALVLLVFCSASPVRSRASWPQSTGGCLAIRSAAIPSVISARPAIDRFIRSLPDVFALRDIVSDQETEIVCVTLSLSLCTCFCVLFSALSPLNTYTPYIPWCNERNSGGRVSAVLGPRPTYDQRPGQVYRSGFGKARGLDGSLAALPTTDTST